MAKTHHEIFKELLEKAKNDDNIIGFFLGGSRGKGYENEHSDYDVRMIVKDSVAEEYKKDFEVKELPHIDLVVSSLSEFIQYAEWQSDTHWDRYNFTHVRAVVDETGEIQKLIDEKGSIPKDRREDFINRQLDAYVNGFFRSVKSFQKKDLVGIRLEAASSLPCLLNALFALHDRATPFADYLTKELQRRSLEKFPWQSKELLDALLKILENGDLRIQQKLVKMVETVFRKEGFNKVFDDWEDKLPWAMNFKADPDLGI